MEREVVLNRGRRLHRIDLEGGADVGERRGSERQRLRVMLLPALVLGAEVEAARVLQIRGQDDGLITGFSRQLDSEVPRVERHKGELEVLGEQVLLREAIKGVDGISK